MGAFSKEEQVHGDYDPEKSVPTYSAPDHQVVSSNADILHRSLGNRQIQLIAIGGSIGTLNGDPAVHLHLHIPRAIGSKSTSRLGYPRVVPVLALWVTIHRS